MRLKQIIHFVILAYIVLASTIIVTTLTINLLHPTYYISIGSGDSMQPTMANTNIMLLDTTTDDYNKTDIIAFHTNYEQVAHRIHDKYANGDETYYKPKGDGNNKPDPVLLTEDDIQGEVVHWIPIR